MAGLVPYVAPASPAIPGSEARYLATELRKIQNAIASTRHATDGLLASANNLSDVADAPTSRTNLGLGDVATHADAEYLHAASNLSDVANAATARTNLGLGTVSTHADTDYLHAASNLSDVANTTTARTNLGISTVGNTGAYADLTGKPTLGTAAAYNVNVAGGIPTLDGSGRYLGFDGSQITNLPAPTNIPSSSTFPVNALALCFVVSTSVGAGATTGGSNLALFQYSASAASLTAGAAQSAGSTWLNVSGAALFSGDGGYFVRVA